jgi:hypothetical protein
VVQTKNVPAINRTALSKGIEQHTPDTPADIIKAVSRFPQGYQAKALKTTPAKYSYGNNKDYGK